MDTQVDKFGRIVIPKIIRDHLGLKPGSILHVEEINHDIILKVVDQAPQVINKGGVLVFTGKATEDLDSMISKMREERLDKFWKN